MKFHLHIFNKHTREQPNTLISTEGKINKFKGAQIYFLTI